MSSEPGRRARIQPEHRASAKAHVMHDYQRKTAEKRLAQWKMSTPRTYSLAPKEESHATSESKASTSNEQAVVRFESVVFQPQSSQPQPEERLSPAELSSSLQTGLSSQQISSPVSSQTSASQILIRYQSPPIFTQPQGSTRLDAFSALPLHVQPWDETLIIRWLNYDRIPWCPVNGQSQWIPFVTQSPMLLHTNLYCWGMHWHGKLTGLDQHIFLRQNPQILEHKITAIQMINEYIESQADVTDEVLAAVAIFINVSMQFLDRDEAIRHMAGLETLVRLRGGLGHLSHIGAVGVLLQRMISWNDLFFVELFGGDLRFAQLPRWDEAWQAVYAPLADDPVTHLEPLQARFAGNLAQEMMTMLREIQVVCDDIQARPLGTLNTAEKTLRHDNLLRFERRLCLATRITTISGNRDQTLCAGNDAMWRSVAYAALMFVHHHIRGFPRHGAQFPALVVHLRNEMSLATSWAWDTVPALHLWVLAVGSWVSQREEWIENMLADACRERGCTSWDAFDHALRLCPNMGFSDEEKFRVTWDDVARLL